MSRIFLFIFGVAAISYPFWGGALFLMFCISRAKKFDRRKPKILKVLVIAPIATLLFAPGFFGTEGFAIVAHWTFTLFLIDEQNKSGMLGLIGLSFLVTFILASIIVLVTRVKN